MNQSGSRLRSLYQKLEKRQNPDSDASNIPETLSKLKSESALLAFEDEEGEIVIEDLDGNYVAQIDQGETFNLVEFDIIRRIALDDDTGTVSYGYFVRLLADGQDTITVNGQTFVNTDSTDFIIGPLEEFTTIECVGQALLFWRSRADLRYGTIGRKPTADELQLRKEKSHRGRRNAQITVEKLADEDASVFKDVSSPIRGDERQRSNSRPGSRQASRNRSTAAARSIAISLPPRIKIPDVKSNTKPCKEFHRRLKELTKNIKFLTWEMEYNHRNDNLGGIDAVGKMFTFEDVLLSIASVTVAINEAAPLTGGFGILPEKSIWACFIPEDEEELEPVVRFGRPLLIPLYIRDQTRVFVLQMEAGSPTISILDSSPWTANKHIRNQIYGAGLAILRRSKWWRRGNEAAYPRPRKANWVIVPNSQPASDSNSVHTIFNAWTLALGLELASQLPPFSVEQFESDARDLICLARGGLADMDLIVSFLLCYGFAKPPKPRSIAPRRRFGNTARLPNAASLDRKLAELRAEDEAFARSAGLRHIRAVVRNRVQLPQGIPHDSDIPSDSWKKPVRQEFLAMVKEGLTVSDLDEAGLRKKRRKASWHSMSPTKVKDKMQEYLREQNIEFENQDPSRYLETQSALRSPLRFRQYKQIEEKPCEYFKKHIRQLVELRDQLNEGREVGLEHQLPDKPGVCVDKDGHRFFLYVDGSWSYIDENGDPMVFLDENGEEIELPPKESLLYLDEDNITLAIYSVTEAIMKLQAPFDPEHQGGFTLTIPAFHELAAAGQNPGFQVARGRRCWLLDIALAGSLLDEIMKKAPKYDDNNSGHHILAVVQEEAGPDGNSYFGVRFYDSHPHFLRSIGGDGALDIVYERIRKIAEELGWTTHRNKDNNIPWREGYVVKEVAQQRGGWQCGYHTIMNAWILAMGLTPNPNPSKQLITRFDEDLRNLVEVALAGLLDWGTLYAFFRCWDLIAEDKTVPLDRQFRNTQRQTRDGFEHRLYNDYIPYDFDLGKKTVKEAPYDYSTNVPAQEGDKLTPSALMIEAEVPGYESLVKINKKDGFAEAEIDRAAELSLLEYAIALSLQKEDDQNNKKTLEEE